MMVKKMSKFVTFKQYDSRWGKKNYNGSSNMAGAGCGPSSVANLVYPINHKINPWTVAKYMKKHGYAVYNHGTDWDGIPAAMKHYGMEDVKNINVSNSMANVWGYLRKGYVADFLFSAGSRGGVCWTTQGHYVAVTDYKLKNGKHWLYTRDSGGRDHDGWYCYETQMRGLVFKVWVGKLPGESQKPKKETTYSGKFPTLPERGYFKRGDSGENVKLLQRFLKWAIEYSIDIDGELGGETVRAIMTFERLVGLDQDGHFGKKCLKAAKKFKN